MYFLIQRPLENAIMIEVQSVGELQFQMINLRIKDHRYGEFCDKDLERIFNEKRRNMKSRVFSNDDNNTTIYRLLKTERKGVCLNICKDCAKEGVTIYIPNGSICDTHMLIKYKLYDHITYDRLDREGLIELIPVDMVVNLLRKIDGVLSRFVIDRALRGATEEYLEQKRNKT